MKDLDWEELTIEAINQVNPFSRRELMQAKTRELMAFIPNHIDLTPDLVRELNRYDMLADAFPLSEELEWDGSRPEKLASSILSRIAL